MVATRNYLLIGDGIHLYKINC